MKLICVVDLKIKKFAISRYFKLFPHVRICPFMFYHLLTLTFLSILNTHSWFHACVLMHVFTSACIHVKLYIYVSDDLNLGWLIHYVSGHRMPKPCKAMGNLKSDTLSLIHHMILWIVIWIWLISITAAPPKYYHILLLSSKYSKRSHKVLQEITSSHYQELQRMDLLQPAACFSQIRCPSER